MHNANMESPWQPQPQRSDNHNRHHTTSSTNNHHQRGSLGLFIERSTSAPPASSLEPRSLVGNVSDLLLCSSCVGWLFLFIVYSLTFAHCAFLCHVYAYGSLQDLLDAVTKGYGDMNLNKHGSSLQRAAGAESFEQGAASSFLQGNYDSFVVGGGRGASNNNNDSGGAVHSSKGMAISRPLSASGTTTTINSSEDGNERGLYNFGTEAFARNSPVQLERSQSAAPSFLSPPPGLGGGSGSGAIRNPTDPNDFFRRSSSASGGGAVKPAAKTLMDLIQEDIPSDNTSPDGVDVTANPYELSSGNRNPRNITSSKVQSSLQQQVDYGRRSGSPAVVLSRPSSQQSSSLQQVSSLQQQASRQRQMQGSPYDQQQALLQQQQQQPQQVGTPSMMGSVSSLQQHVLRDQLSPQQQQIYQQQQDMSGMQRYTQGSPPLMEQQLLQQQQYGGIPFRQDSPEIQQQGGMFVQNAPQQMHIQQHLQPQQQQQQIFYGGQQASMQGLQGLQQQQQGIQQQQPNIQNLQAHVLPNGQTVYIDTGSAQHQQQAQGFGGYGNVQYQSPHQPAQIVHQQMSGEQRGQYVSVVPMQGGGQRVTYWQPNGLSQQQALQSGMMSGPGGVPVVLNSLGGPTAIDSQFGGLRRDSKGGRSSNMNTNNARRGSNNPRGRGGEKSSTMTSPLLEEFRSTKTRDWTVRRIEGHVVEFCQDQNGSRFIQQRLEMGNVAEQQLVMQEVLPAIRRLRNDVFGNYVIQKLLDFGTPDMKSDIRETLEGEMLQLSLQMYGCRVVQKALESLDEDELPRLLREFHHNVLSCIHDQNGNHVIQKCIEVLNHRAHKAATLGDVHRANFLEEQIDFIIDDVLINTAALSCHPYGCRVLQRILEHCGEQRKTEILDEIKKCHKKLLDDQYGNYVIQHVLQFGREDDRDSILQIVVESGLLGMSRQKFASNVVEKLLKYGNGNQRRAVVREMLKVRLGVSWAI